MTSPTAQSPRILADWREGAQYTKLRELDRIGWAWEWLRRNPDYTGGADDAGITNRRIGRAEVTIIRNADSEEGARWGLTFC